MLAPARQFAVARGAARQFALVRAAAARGGFSPAAGPLRCLSAGAPPPSSWRASAAAASLRAAATTVNKFGPAAALGAGGLVVVYGISSLGLWGMSSFLSLTLTDALHFGFGAGFASAALLGAGAARAYAAVTLAPDAVFRSALVKLEKDARVAALLGDELAPGTLRAYHTEVGGGG
jgi:hypothetical protein